MDVKIKKLHQDAVIPKYATSGSGCLDIGFVMDGDICPKVEKGSSLVLHTGLAFEIPKGYVMQVFSRSGHGFKSGLRLSNCVGLIDSDFRGELMVKLHNDGNTDVIIDKYARIAQAMIIPIPKINFIESDTLSETDRGDGGFGSTGN